MTDPSDISPHWIEEIERDSYVTKAHVVMVLAPPSANPDAPGAKLLLAIEDGDGDDLSLDRIMGENAEVIDGHVYRWHLSIDENDSGFEDGEFESDARSHLEDAKRDCWDAVVTFLRGEGYSDTEIVSGM